MKKILAIALALLMLTVMSVEVAAAFNRSYTAPMATVKVDGEIDPIWEKAEWTNVDKPHDGTADTNSTMKIKLLWDPDFLYFLAEVYDEDLNADNDIVEVYIDQNQDKAGDYGADDYQTRFKIGGGGVVKDSGKNCQNDAKHVAKSLGGNKYLVEGALKWLGGAPKEGSKHGLEFMYNEGSKTADFVQAYRWNVDTANGDPAPYASTAAFGTLTLAGPPVVETTAAATTAAAAEAPAKAPAQAAQTFDFVTLAAAAALISASGVIISKKRK
ncbi:MAG: hypothetical protein GX628_00725 [Clostridiales bacterium]|nr:hypothetical protein [Clostridiales bacterium]